MKGLVVTDKIRIKGFPIIYIRNGGRIQIEKNVVLNSRNYGYHINMFCPVKLFADRSEAIISIGSETRIMEVVYTRMTEYPSEIIA